MKLKTKLIPIIASASVAATVAPITLTSCGHRYTDMLYQYQTGVTPYKATTFINAYSAETVYTYRIWKNPDILRDDILFSISTLFNTEASRKKINEYFSFTRYNLDLWFDTEQSQIDPNITFVNATIQLDVTGKATGVLVQDKTLGAFDLSITVKFHNLDSVYVDMVDFEGQKGVDGLKDYYLAFLPLSSSTTEIITEGTCEGLTYSDKDKKEYNYHIFFNSVNDVVDDVEQYSLFDKLLYKLSLAAGYEEEDPFDVGIVYASHYLKDCTILNSEE